MPSQPASLTLNLDLCEGARRAQLAGGQTGVVGGLSDVVEHQERAADGSVLLRGRLLPRLLKRAGEVRGDTSVRG